MLHKVFWANHALQSPSASFLTHWMLCSHTKHFWTIKTLAYLMPSRADTLPTECLHTTNPKILGISEKALFCWPQRGTKYPLQSRGEIYFQSCLVWAPLDCTCYQARRQNQFCWWHHIGCDSGAAGFLFGEVEVLFTRNPKAKCLVFPCKLSLPLFFTWLFSLLLPSLFSKASASRGCVKKPAQTEPQSRKALDIFCHPGL